MKLSKLLAFAGGVSVIALGTIAVMYLRHQMHETRESTRQMVRQTPVEADKEAGNEVRAGMIEGTDQVADPVDQMPAPVFQSATDESQRRVTGFADAVGGDGRLQGRVLQNILDLVTEPAQNSQPSLSSETETPASIPQAENVLGDFADLPEPPNASADDQASPESPSRARSTVVPEDLDQTLDRYFPSNGNKLLHTVDRILDDPRIQLTGLLGGSSPTRGERTSPSRGIGPQRDVLSCA